MSFITTISVLERSQNFHNTLTTIRHDDSDEIKRLKTLLDRCLFAFRRAQRAQDAKFLIKCVDDYKAIRTELIRKLYPYLMPGPRLISPFSTRRPRRGSAFEISIPRDAPSTTHPAPVVASVQAPYTYHQPPQVKARNKLLCSRPSIATLLFAATVSAPLFYLGAYGIQKYQEKNDPDSIAIAISGMAGGLAIVSLTLYVRSWLARNQREREDREIEPSSPPLIVLQMIEHG